MDLYIKVVKDPKAKALLDKAHMISQEPILEIHSWIQEAKEFLEKHGQTQKTQDIWEKHIQRMEEKKYHDN